MKSNEDNIFKIVDKLQEEFCCILANNCDSINDCLGISVEGDETLFLNQVGDWVEAGGGSSQWITTGSDIYYNTGNVGIGTNTPAYLLTVFGDMFLSNGTYTHGFLNIFPSSGIVQIGDNHADVNGTSIQLDDGASAIFYNAPNGHQFQGNVGIGTTPIVALDVVGDVTLHAGDSAGLQLIEGTKLSTIGDYGGTGNLTKIVIDDDNTRVNIVTGSLLINGSIGYTGTLAGAAGLSVINGLIVI